MGNQPRKRRRIAKSCQQCRQRKVGCDRNVPCGPCTRSRAPLACTYSQEPPIGEDEEQSPSQGGRSPSGMQQREPVRERNDGTISNDSAVEQTLRDLTEKVQKFEQQLKSLTNREEPSDGGDEGFSFPATKPRLLAPASKMKFLGPTHWSHKVDELSFAKSFKGKETDPSFQMAKAELAGVIKECQNLRHSIKSQPAAQLNQLLTDLRKTFPNRAACDQLVYSYLRTFELIYRVLHIPSFWKEYDKFWEQPEAAESLFVIKLMVILAIGTTFYPHKGAIAEHPYRSLTQKWIYGAQWWLTGPLEKSTFSMDGLQLFCLVLISRQACGLGASPWLSTGALLNMAMTMGLHREPETFPALSVFQSEMRARLWTTVLELVVQSSLDSGTPILLPQGFETRKPMNIDDKDISPDSVTAPIPKPNNQPTESSIQILLSQSLRLRVEAVELINACPKQSYKKVLDMGTELREICRNIASFFQSYTLRWSTNDSQVSSFHRTFLDMLIRRYILFLHTPFMLQAKTKPEFYYSRKVCLESAMVIASFADNLNLPNYELDDISRLIMIGKGPFKGPLSLDIISVIGLEIVTQLEEESPTQLSTNTMPDRLDELTKANREPLISKLKHLLEQLRQIIVMGCPSFKRYGVLSAMLGQISAMGSGQSIKQVIYDTLTTGLKECCNLLKESTAQELQEPDDTLANMAGVNAQVQPDPSLAWLDVNLEDPNLDWDLPTLLGVPDLSDINTFDF
ncbi:Transcription factor [Aspergillus sclerotialis]|uniref:Transcription factor n=1 Tax=Aspergillus sclerotialis TaxID=2070753 RepID=A0A3A2ZV44_9EURO|nr:Transcription factor [Aspergillus sclerotialis]